MPRGVVAPSISHHSGGRAHSSPAWTPRGENGSAAVIGIGWNDLDIRHQRASNLGLGGLIAGGILLSPMFAFLMTLVVEILIGLLKDGGAPALLTLVAARRRVPLAKAAEVPAI